MIITNAHGPLTTAEGISLSFPMEGATDIATASASATAIPSVNVRARLFPFIHSLIHTQYLFNIFVSPILRMSYSAKGISSMPTRAIDNSDHWSIYKQSGMPTHQLKRGSEPSRWKYTPKCRNWTRRYDF